MRYFSNGSSGQMGRALATAAIDQGYEVIIVSGPVSIEYPDDATVVRVVSTQQMHDAVMNVWPECIGLIAAAAPSDFRPAQYSKSKIKKSSDSDRLSIEMVSNVDIVAEAGKRKSEGQWTIGFALETDNAIENALAKLKRKNTDFIVLNDPTAIDANESSVRIIDGDGEITDSISGSKQVIAARILALKPLEQ
ncbi:phosphopantothenoylcysteine decarboxylase [Mariniblastus fucicola]|uniref:phosphopantothenoylcysteine decarboxylase n=1 Tax=Mariniblastus fucicola TaxID=980251 RepID=UPI001EE3C7D7|nr:phosphopantothenoylcysteine decarboxylase [Mariniblastus fucicola]